jgi:hypothetical protein
MPDLPSEPSLQQLRHQARDLQRAVRRGDQDALAEVAGRHPAGRPDGAAAAQFPLSAAQLVVARRYDFTSWARHFGQEELIALLEPLTTSEDALSSGAGVADLAEEHRHAGRGVDDRE